MYYTSTMLEGGRCPGNYLEQEGCFNLDGNIRVGLIEKEARAKTWRR